ncbi:MAG: hypothetical protein IT385_21625 [Deltaproteobacteria bacterium]|nr:hypothetical protein [Deltaproteobacteria bacterium]
MKHRPAVAPILLAVVGLALAGAACENNRTQLSEKQSVEGLGIPDTSSSGKKITLDARCNLDELISDPAAGTPDAVIYTMIEAAAAAAEGKDEDGNFQKFFSQFMEGTEEKRVKMDFWGRAKKFVSKYLQQDASAGVQYKICERRDEGNGEIKIFIQSLDKQKSNPPIKLKKDATGAWKVTFYTP